MYRTKPIDRPHPLPGGALPWRLLVAIAAIGFGEWALLPRLANAACGDYVLVNGILVKGDHGSMHGANQPGPEHSTTVELALNFVDQHLPGLPRIPCDGPSCHRGKSLPVVPGHASASPSVQRACLFHAGWEPLETSNRIEFDLAFSTDEAHERRLERPPRCG